MDTSNTITNFFANAVQRDFARDILFRVSLIEFSNGGLFNENDLVYAKAASLPARKIGNVEAKYAGLTFNLPGTVSFPGSDSYEIDFYCSQNSDLRTRFLNESERTFDHISGVAGSGVTDGVSNGTIANGRSQIILVQYDKSLNAVGTYGLIGCSIRDVGAMDFQIAEGTGAIMSFKVQIAYHYFNYIAEF
jgi:hypothetical protein